MYVLFALMAWISVSDPINIKLIDAYKSIYYFPANFTIGGKVHQYNMGLDMNTDVIPLIRSYGFLHLLAILKSASIPLSLTNQAISHMS